MRKKIFEIIELSKKDNLLSSIYDIFMIIVIFCSILPLCFKNTNKVLDYIDFFCVVVFVVDYFLRWITADYKYDKKSVISFLRYPFGFFAIIDLVSILPSIMLLNKGFKLLRILRMSRAFRVFRTFKMLRYSKSVKIISVVFRKIL